MFLADERPGPSGHTAGGTGQLRVARAVRLGGRSARAERLESDLRGPWSIAPRTAQRSLRWSGRRACVGDGGVDPVRTKLSNVARIIRVAIVMMPGRLERGIGSKTLDRHREREEKDDRKNPSDDPVHTGMISR